MFNWSHTNLVFSEESHYHFYRTLSFLVLVGKQEASEDLLETRISQSSLQLHQLQPRGRVCRNSAWETSQDLLKS